METHILEGTLTQVQEQLRTLSLPRDSRVRLLLHELNDDEVQPGIRNGVSLIPRRRPDAVVTSELVHELVDGE